MTVQIYIFKQLEKIKEALDHNPNYNQVELESWFQQRDSKFGIFNFHLLNQALNEQDYNLQITMPDKYYKSKVLTPFLFSTLIIKYAQNLKSKDIYPNNLESIKRGDIYCVGEGRFAQVKHKVDNKCFLQYLVENHEEKTSNTTIEKSLAELTPNCKMRGDFEYNRDTKKNLKEFHNFFKRYIPKFSFLTQFNRKSIIISNQSILKQEQKKILPFRYEGDSLDSLPIEPLIEVFNSYKNARKFIKKNNLKIDDLIILGAEKYQSDFGQLINDKNDGLFNKLILIGSKKVKESSFKYWHWTEDEIQNLMTEKKEKRKLEQVSIKNTTLGLFKNNLDTFKSKIVNHGVDADEIESINNFFITLFSKYFQEGNKERARGYINSLFQEENDFDDAIDHLDHNTKMQLSTEYQTIISEFLLNGFKNKKIEYLKSVNPKINYRIVTPRSFQKESIQEFVSKQNNKRLKVIDNKEIEAYVSEKTILNGQHNVFIIPHVRFHYNRPLYYYHLYQKSRYLADVHFLCYEGIDEKRLSLFKSLHNKQITYKITHEDRLHFVDVPCPVKNPLDEEEKEIMEMIDSIEDKKDKEQETLCIVKEYFKARFKSIEELGKPRKRRTGKGDNITTKPVRGNLYIQKNNSTYIITFLDTTKQEVKAFSPIALSKGTNNYQLIYPKDLKENYRIITDWDITLSRILPFFPNKGALGKYKTSIQNGSREWKRWLNDLVDVGIRAKGLKRDQAIMSTYEKISPSVSITTFRSWLKNSDSYFFPRANEDWKKIMEARRRIIFKDTDKEIFDKSIAEISKGSSAILYALKEELILHISNRDKGPLLSKMDDKSINILTRKKITKTIKQIQKL